MAGCPRCGSENAEHAKFCSECGAALTAPARREERKVVTVLFADLVGFTHRSERMDVEDVQGTLVPYHRLLRRELERHGGTVEKFIGDAVMALFGAPVAHEDDPERAVRAALAIQRAVADLRASDAGLDLHVRIGVNTGEALVALDANPSAGEGMASGDVVNTAARLQSAAPVDGVLVGDQTRRATDRVITYAAAPPVQAKGKSEPVVAWIAGHAVSAVPEQAREQVALVGRERELAVLREAFERSRHDPAVQLVTLIGPPGIGKSRLVAELFTETESLPELVTWRRGRSLAYGDGVALWALGEIVKAHAGILESDAADVAAAKLESAVAAVVPDERDRGWVGRHLQPLVGISDGAGAGEEAGREEAFAAWRLFFESLAESRPTVLVFEDAHWADDTLLDFVDVLCDRAGGVPLLVLCVARPELLNARPAWGGGKLNATTIALAPLREDETARLVGGLLGQAVLPAELQHTLLERAEGNPLYAQEFVRMLQDEGLLRKGAAGWSLDGEIEGLPESIQGIVAARLDSLSEAEKALVQDAAVVGKTAWLGSVRALGERSGWEADEILHGLERRQLLQRVRRSSIDGEVEFRFEHTLTRDVAYGQIKRADRAAKHEAFAAWIEGLSGSRDDKAELLAAHYGQALRLRQELGQDATDAAGRAAAAFADAGHRAAALHSHAAAARHFGAALELSADAPIAARASLLLGLSTAHWLSEAPEARESLERAIEALREADDQEGTLRAERNLASWFRYHEVNEEMAAVHHAAAMEIASRLPPNDVTCSLVVDESILLAVSGHPQDAVDLCNRTLVDVDAAGLAVGRAVVLSARAYARVAAGDPGGIEDGREAAIVMAREGHRAAPMTFGNLADTTRGLGDMASASEAYESGLAWAERFGSQAHIDWLLGEQAAQAYHAGTWDAGFRLVERMNQNNQFARALACAGRGRLRLGSGDAAGALEDAGVVVAFAEALSNDEALYTGLAARAMALVALGRDADARADADRFLERWFATGGIVNRTLDLCDLAPLLCTAGRTDELRRTATALPVASRWREPLLALADGRHRDAADAYADIGSRPLEMTSLLLVDDAGAREECARRVLEFAAVVGAPLWRAQAEAMLATALEDTG